MVTGFLTVLDLLLMLSVLVVVHEWGHFIVARIFKIRVDEFSLGFGPRLLRIGQRGDTEYNIRWILLGGYVKIAGMEPDEQPILDAKEKAKGLIVGKDPNKAEIPLFAENTSDHAEDDVQRRRDAIDGFYSKPGWQRALVIFAGPLMSFLLGVFIFCSLGATIGLPAGTGTAVARVIPHSAADNMGLKAGDKIVAIDAKPVPANNGVLILTVIHSSIGKPVTLSVERQGKILSLTGTPAPGFSDGHRVGLLGFSPTESNILHRTSILTSIKAGFMMTGDYMTQIGHVFGNVKQIAKNTGGMIEIGAMTNEAVKQGSPLDIISEWSLLTISLALFNLLPIPVLDGGHLLIIAIEGCRKGRRLTPEQQQNFMIAGLAIIATLFILVTTRGVIRLIEGKLPHFM